MWNGSCIRSKLDEFQSDLANFIFSQAKFNKTYNTTDEELEARGVFEANNKEIKKHNAQYEKGNELFKLEQRPRSDLKPEEFASRRLGYKKKVKNGR